MKLFCNPRFGNGYTIILRVSGQNPDLGPVMEFITDSFSSAKLREKHHNMLQVISDCILFHFIWNGIHRLEMYLHLQVFLSCRVLYLFKIYSDLKSILKLHKLFFCQDQFWQHISNMVLEEKVFFNVINNNLKNWTGLLRAYHFLYFYCCQALWYQETSLFNMKYPAL